MHMNIGWGVNSDFPRFRFQKYLVQFLGFLNKCTDFFSHKTNPNFEVQNYTFVVLIVVLSVEFATAEAD